ncbi:D-3-phosphoglycerate dehydrogenase [Toxocara canis]|uniref:D-3-phosphoglycerate dehydrogenase n=1 Tax=Toxocara canis TaxID=6265 RepID=A0A0B2VN17_TOXCA|nr:D-3-phosphoglycerate dehydrogenase [Toxocara canis]
MFRVNSILIADEIEQNCVDILQANGLTAVKKTKLSKEQLIAELTKHDAVIVRSATKITREVIEAVSGKLKLIGRAGTGVDNIDLVAATEHGVVVMNTPDDENALEIGSMRRLEIMDFLQGQMCKEWDEKRARESGRGRVGGQAARHEQQDTTHGRGPIDRTEELGRRGARPYSAAPAQSRPISRPLLETAAKKECSSNEAGNAPPLRQPAMVYTAAQLPKFTTHPATFIPTVFGGHVLVYESRSHPGHRREFAFKTRFTNQSGVSSCYYRCMSCRSMKNKVPPGPDGKPPQIPCIAVKNGYIVNDPDFPEANDHFCIPPTIEESKQKEENGFAKAIVKGRPRQKQPRITRAPTTKRQPYLAQLQAYQEMTNALINDASNMFDISNGFDIDQTFSSASTSSFLSTLSNGDVCDEMKLNGFGNGDLKKISCGSGFRLEDDDSDSTTKANNLLASLISTEPALRSALALTTHRNSAPLTVDEENTDFCQEFRRSPESYTALVINSISRSDSRPASASSASAAVSNSRKRKASPNVEPHLEQILDRYITNNWELPDNAGNSRSAAELTCVCILSLARHVPQAAASMKAGKWARKEFMGEEVYGKTLAIIGLGRIGTEVAVRMQSFGMTTIGFDPLVSSEDAAKNGIKWVPLDQLWPQADYITVHVPLIPQTENLLSAATLAKCKKGVKIVNVARGGIVNETDLLDSINRGHTAGAALDVFAEEPPSLSALVEHPKVICTPHLGASTNEAQERVANEIAENIVALNNGTGLYGALNAAALSAVLDDAKAQWVRAASALTHVLSVIADSPKSVTLRYPKAASGLQKALTAGAVVGLLQASGNAGMNLVNAELNAKREGINVKLEPNTENELLVCAGETSVCGYSSPAGTIISAFNASKMPVPLIAVGTLAVNLKQNGAVKELSDSLKAKLSVEYGLLGGGRVALFDSLNSDQVEELSNSFDVIQF